MRRYYNKGGSTNNKGGGADMGRDPLLKKLDKITSGLKIPRWKLTDEQKQNLYKSIPDKYKSKAVPLKKPVKK